MGKGDGKGGSISKTGCTFTRRELEVSVANFESYEQCKFETYDDLANLNKDWLNQTGTQDSDGNIVGDKKKLLHFRSQDRVPLNHGMPTNLTMPLRHEIMGITSDMVKGDDEKLQIMDKNLYLNNIETKFNKPYFDLERKIFVLNDDVKKLAEKKNDLNLSENKRNKKTVTKQVSMIDNKIKKLQKTIKDLQKEQKKLDGHFVTLRKKIFKDNQILISRGAQNSYTGTMCSRILRKRPHLILFKIQTFEIPNSGLILKVGSHEVFQNLNHLYQKLSDLSDILWTVHTLCVHEMKIAELRLISWWKCRIKNLPYKVPTYKEHLLRFHTLSKLKVRKSIGREGEEGTELNMKNIKKQRQVSRSLHNPEHRVQNIIRRSNLRSKTCLGVIDGNRKRCLKCKLFIGKKNYPHCTCYRDKSEN
jgi:hypothetical protein